MDIHPEFIRVYSYQGLEANEQMSINSGKQEFKTFSFLGRNIRIDKIPAGIAIPFSIEIEKVRVMSMKAAQSIADDADNIEDMTRLVQEYFSNNDHLEEAYEMQMQTIKAISVFTEFMTNGELTEDIIKHEADQEEVNEFMIELQDAINTPLKKHLAKLTAKEKEEI